MMKYAMRQRHSHFSMMNYELDSHMKIPVLYYTMMWLSFVASENLMLISRPTSTMDTHSCSTFVGTTIICLFIFFQLYQTTDDEGPSELSILTTPHYPQNWWTMYSFVGTWCMTVQVWVPALSIKTSLHTYCGHRIVKQYSLHMHSHNSTPS